MRLGGMVGSEKTLPRLLFFLARGDVYTLDKV
jgi:hypothetical protein